MEHRRPFLGVELLANRGMNAIAGDDDVGSQRGQWLPLRIDEMGDGALHILFDRDAALPGDDVLGADPFACGAVKHHQQLAAMDRKMRIFVTREEAARFAVDELPMMSEISEFLRLDADASERVEQAEPGKLADRVGLQVDADAQRHQRWRRLANANAKRHAGAVQRERQGLAADAAADDENVERFCAHRAHIDVRARCSVKPTGADTPVCPFRYRAVTPAVSCLARRSWLSSSTVQPAQSNGPIAVT